VGAAGPDPGGASESDDEDEDDDGGAAEGAGDDDDDDDDDDDGDDDDDDVTGLEVAGEVTCYVPFQDVSRWLPGTALERAGQDVAGALDEAMRAHALRAAAAAARGRAAATAPSSSSSSSSSSSAMGGPGVIAVPAISARGVSAPAFGLEPPAAALLGGSAAVLCSALSSIRGERSRSLPGSLRRALAQAADGGDRAPKRPRDDQHSGRADDGDESDEDDDGAAAGSPAAAASDPGSPVGAREDPGVAPLASLAQADRLTSSALGAVASLGGSAEASLLVAVAGANDGCVARLSALGPAALAADGVLISHVASGMTALHIAAALGRAASARALLASGLCSTLDRDALARTPLHIAALRGHTSVAEVLCSPWSCQSGLASAPGGAPPPSSRPAPHRTPSAFSPPRPAFDSSVLARDDGFLTPLHIAALRGHAGTAAAIAARAPSSVELRDVCGRLPIHHAAAAGRTAAVLALAAAGSQLDAKDHFGNTPLHRAALNGHQDTVVALVERLGCSLDWTDSNGYTAVHEACVGNAPGVLVACHVLFGSPLDDSTLGRAAEQAGPQSLRRLVRLVAAGRTARTALLPAQAPMAPPRCPAAVPPGRFPPGVRPYPRGSAAASAGLPVPDPVSAAAVLAEASLMGLCTVAVRRCLSWRRRESIVQWGAAVRAAKASRSAVKRRASEDMVARQGAQPWRRGSDGWHTPVAGLPPLVARAEPGPPSKRQPRGGE